MGAKPAQPTDRPPPTVAEVESVYRFREPDEVRSFLAAHPEVLDVVVEAASKIPEFLPVEEPPFLEVVRDHDDDDHEGDLFAVVPTRLEPEDVRPRMERLRREWLVPTLQGAKTLFVVGVEYH